MIEKSKMFPEGGTAALKEVAEVTEAVRDSLRNVAAPPTTPGQFATDVTRLRNIGEGTETVEKEGVQNWWKQVRGQSNPGGSIRGWAWDARVSAARAGDGTLLRMNAVATVNINGQDELVNIDGWTKHAATGKRVASEFKHSDSGIVKATPKNKAQMLKQVLLVKQSPSAVVEAELRWYVNRAPDDALRAYAVRLASEHGVSVKFFNDLGVPA